MCISLVTGGAGFIGSHLAEALLDKGEEVIVFDDLSTGCFDNIRRLAARERFSYVLADLSEEQILEETIGRADTVYHLAAAVGVQLIVQDPVRTIETNIEGAGKLLRLAARRGKRVLLASTSEVYGKGTRIPFAEDDDTVFGPTSRCRWSYAFSKAVDEFLALAYHESKGLPVVVVRLFNTVGPRQVGHYGMVIPRFIEQALSGGPITVFGDGEQSRCFCHVADVVKALYNLMKCPEAYGKVVNLGCDEETTINALAEKVRAKIDPVIEIRRIPYEQAYRPGFEDMRRRVPCIDRARELVDFRATHTLDDILDDVIAWTRESQPEHGARASTP